MRKYIFLSLSFTLFSVVCIAQRNKKMNTKENNKPAIFITVIGDALSSEINKYITNYFTAKKIKVLTTQLELKNHMTEAYFGIFNNLDPNERGSKPMEEYVKDKLTSIPVIVKAFSVNYSKLSLRKDSLYASSFQWSTRNLPPSENEGAVVPVKISDDFLAQHSLFTTLYFVLESFTNTQKIN